MIDKMPHRLLDLESIVSTIVAIISLQITSFGVGIEIDEKLKLQFAGLLGSMLAVRTIDGRIRFVDWLRVSVSGLILANFIGFAWCEYREIKLDTYRALFSFFALGFFSDILLRCSKSFGSSFVEYVPEITKALSRRIAALFKGTK